MIKNYGDLLFVVVLILTILYVLTSVVYTTWSIANAIL